MTNTLETATLGGGCFWCTEAVFIRLKGVESVVSGYSGGKINNPSYDQVSMGSTGHAEAVQIKFDPQIISFATLLDIFFHTHNPTTMNQQGADVGTQYRSVIFYYNQAQKEVALKSKSDLEKSGEYSDPIVTQILPFENFYTAEEYHQKYYDSNPSYPYCSVVIDPKIQKLLEKYSSLVKPEYRSK